MSIFIVNKEIQSKRIKPNPELINKAKAVYMQNHALDRETMLSNLFQKLELTTS